MRAPPANRSVGTDNRVTEPVAIDVASVRYRAAEVRIGAVSCRRRYAHPACIRQPHRPTEIHADAHETATGRLERSDDRISEAVGVDVSRGCDSVAEVAEATPNYGRNEIDAGSANEAGRRPEVDVDTSV